MAKPKVLLLSDDLRTHSGIGTMSNKFVLGTLDRFDWVQVAAAVKHNEEGSRLDMSESVSKHTGIPNSSLILYPSSGYGNPQLLRAILKHEKPDVILHFTDPRFWSWLYEMEYEIHHNYKIPIAYYAIWDNLPYPFWNRSAYESCDLIMAINKQSHLIHRKVLEQYGNVVTDVADASNSNNGTLLSYVPHGIDSNEFRPIRERDSEWESFSKFKTNFNAAHNPKFVAFWNNRNITRKCPADVIHGFVRFVDEFPESERSSFVLIMHTNPKDQVGTDLVAVKRAIASDYKILFSVDKVDSVRLNYYYNIADVTINIASNEGFGLSSAESIMAGTMVINNVTGGLQDQMRFDVFGEWYNPSESLPSNNCGDIDEHGSWAIPVYPRASTLKGSIQTPYIFDDFIDTQDLQDALLYVYELSSEERDRRGLEGREWMMSDEANMSASAMSDGISHSINTLLKTWSPSNPLEIIEVGGISEITDSGINYQRDIV